MKTTLFAALTLIVLVAPGFAKDPAEGVWAAPPDGKGQTGHIEIKPCGAALCGTIIKAYGPN